MSIPEDEKASHSVQPSTHFICSHTVFRSLIWCRKPTGPNIVPCGIPALKVVYSDFTLPIFTRYLNRHRKDVSHLMTTFGGPSDAHFVFVFGMVDSVKSFAKIDEIVYVLSFLGLFYFGKCKCLLTGQGNLCVNYKMGYVVLGKRKGHGNLDVSYKIGYTVLAG